MAVFLLTGKALSDVLLAKWGEAAEMWLAFWEVRMLVIAAVILIFCLPWLLKTFKREWDNLKPRTKWLLLAVTCLALFTRLVLPPVGHRVYFDEDIYLNIAQNISANGQAMFSNCGETRYGKFCNYEPIFNKEPNAFPFIGAIIFSLFGVREDLIFLLMQIMGALTILPLFGLGRKLFSEKTGLWAAFLFALVPLHIIWSATAATEIPFLFFTVLTLYLLLPAMEEDNFFIWMALAACLAFTVQFRIEGLLALIPAALLILLKGYRFRLSWALLLGLLLLGLFFPHLVHLNYVQHQDWGAPDGHKFASLYFRNTLPANLAFFGENIYFPLLFTALLLLGFIRNLSRRYWGIDLWILSWMLTFFVPYLFFYAGNFNYGVSVRYALALLPGAMLLAGSGVSWLADWGNRAFQELKMPVSFTVTLLLLLSANFIQYLPTVRAVTEEAWQARADHKFIADFCRRLPDNCFILTHSPSLVLLEGKGSLQTWLLENPFNQSMFKNRKARVFLYEDYWSQVQPQKADIDKIKKNYHLKLVKANQENGQNFNIYEVLEPLNAKPRAEGERMEQNEQ